jgi:hypothetical protein
MKRADIDPCFIEEATALLKAGRHRRGEFRDNPITECLFVHGVDSIQRQIREAAEALQARARFAELNPSLPTLPLCYSDRERMKDVERVGMEHLVAWYARSLAANGYDIDRHPSFHDYTCDVLSDPCLRALLADVAHSFPPRPRQLRSLGNGRTIVKQTP